MDDEPFRSFQHVRYPGSLLEGLWSSLVEEPGYLWLGLDHAIYSAPGLLAACLLSRGGPWLKPARDGWFVVAQLLMLTWISKWTWRCILPPEEERAHLLPEESAVKVQATDDPKSGFSFEQLLVYLPDKCIVCFEEFGREVDTAAVLDCGHACMCSGCAKQWCQRSGGICPICQRQVEAAASVRLLGSW
mmetsp:Transcript_72537/g.170003  ORF Transcript_72537/g.170003 Transcript_72537/m.170003 type:complete len:189 (+) Transcript_72537:84-650(+)